MNKDGLKKMNKSVATERQRLYDLFLQTPAAVGVLLGEKHVFEFANERYLQIAGKDKSIIGKSVRAAFPELKDQGFFELLDGVYASGKAFVGNEMPIELVNHLDGTRSYKYINFVYQPLKNSAGKVEGIMVHAVDVTAQVTARQATEESEERFRIIADESPMFIFLVGKDVTVEFWNKTWLDYTGFSFEESLGVSWEQVVHADDYQKVIKTFGAAFATQDPYSMELRVKGKNGQYRWFFTKGVPRYLPSKDFAGFMGTGVDIHDRKLAEEALRRQLELTNTITNSASACLCMLDNNGAITFMNPAAEIATGYSASEVIGKSLHPIVHHSHPDGSPYPESECPLVETYKYGKPSLLHDDVFFRKNGSAFPVSLTATIVPDLNGVQGTVVEFRDITDEKNAMENLTQSEERFRDLANNISQLAWMTDKDGWIFWYNQRWYEYTGTNLKDMQGWGWKAVHHPKHLNRVLKKFQASLKKDEIWEDTFPLLGSDGKFRWFLSRAVPIHGEDGSITRWFGTNTDIEDLRLANQRKEELETVASDLKEQRTQLLALNEAKDEFISLASHQLRTPASAVKQFVGMILQGYAEDITPVQRELLEHAQESNERQITIVNDLLKVAQVDAGKVNLKKQPTELVRLIEDAIDEQLGTLEAREQKITFQHAQQSITGVVDGARIRMVLDNLIDNASKYTPSGNILTVRIQQTKKWINISVKDHGVGIKEEDIAKLFRKFSRLDNPLSVVVGGTGLGLYWAKKIIDLHGGSITVSSTLRKGSTFTVHLPR